MAVNSGMAWRSALSINLRDSEYSEHEQSQLFQNLEKLIASAVAICRLDGSLQCQIGGLITVIEELQRLLRFSFSEIKTLGRTVDYQKQNFINTVSDLQKQIRDIEVNTSTCKHNGNMSSAPMPPNELPFNHLNGHEGNNGKQAICLVDQSYGNEDESDNSIPSGMNGQPEEEEQDLLNTSFCESNLSDSKDKENNDQNEEKKHVEENKPSNEKPSETQQNTTKNPRKKENAASLAKTTSNEPDEISAFPQKYWNLRKVKDTSESPNRKDIAKKKLTITSSNTKRRASVAVFKSKDTTLNENRRKTISGDQKVKSIPQNNSKTYLKNTNSKRNVVKKDTTSYSARRGRPLGPKRSPSSAVGHVKPKVELDFLLMVNQVMSELVSDSTQQEAAIDDVGEDARKYVVKLAKLFRLRVRMAGKIEGELPVVLVKGRDSCLPKPGEVDVLLSAVSDHLASKATTVTSKKTGMKHKMDGNSSEPNSQGSAKKRKA